MTHLDYFQLSVEHHSTKAGTTEVEILTFPSMPSTFEQISDKIEEQFHIPVAVQTLTYQNCEVSLSISPESLYMRSGDTVRVFYPAKSRASEVREAVKWLQEITEILERLEDSTSEEVALSLTHNNNSIFSKDLLNRGLFTPWSDSSTEINAIQFTSMEGVELLTKFHRQIINVRKFKFHNLSRNILGYLEFICCDTAANFSMNKVCASRLAQCGGLDNCIDTFLFKTADDPSLRRNNMYTVIEIALCAILNISEIPEVQLKLSERSDVIKQALLAGCTYLFSTNTPVMAVSLLLCVSRCYTAHVNLLKPDLVNDIYELCDKEGIIVSIDEFNALRCYAGVALAQMTLGSTILLLSFPVTLLQSVKELLTTVCAFDPEVIRLYESKQKLYWETFIACMQYLYEPELKLQAFDSPELTSLISEIHQRSIEVLLIYLQSSLGRTIHIDIVRNEGLMDYVTTLPWIVPKCLEYRALNVVQEIAKLQTIQPPSLTSIAKSKISKMKLGLRKIMEVYSTSELMMLS